MRRIPLRRLQFFTRDESGAISVWALFLLLAAACIGGVAVDVTQLNAARTQLQVAADAAAHAALVRRTQGATVPVARADAMRVARYAMPASVYGNAIEDADVLWGTYDARADIFRVDPTSRMAVLVTMGREQRRQNAVSTFLLRMAGIDKVDITVSAVAVADADPCASLQGLFANGPVKPNSNNIFSDDICVHSNANVQFQNRNDIETGAYVSAPTLAAITCQNNCPGLAAARRAATYDLEKFLGPLRPGPSGSAGEDRNDLLADVRAALPDWNWTGINQTINVSTNRSPTAGPLNGNVTYIDCRTGSDRVQLAGGNYSKAVLLLHDCELEIKSGDVTLSDTIIYTTVTTERDSIRVQGSGLTIGTDTDCNGSGRAAILTRGGFNAPAKLRFDNGSLYALLDVEFAAQFGHGSGGEPGRGMSIIAGGEIDPTSRNDFNACPQPPGAPPALVTYRLAR